MNILCPTDLSPHSKVALNYAINLANDLGAGIHIISVLEIPQQISSLESIDKILVRSRKDELNHLVAAITPLIKTDYPPTISVLPGFTVEEILRYSEEEDIDLIVMGTQGQNSLRNLLFGSVTKEIVENANLPVLAIPQEIKHKLGSNKMLLSLDNKILPDEHSFDIPKQIADKLNLTIDIIHVDKNKNDEIPFDPFISEYLGELMGDVHLQEGSDPVNEIKKYAQENNVGMLIMIRRKKGLLAKLLFIGNTSEELSRTNIPLMILPE